MSEQDQTTEQVQTGSLTAEQVRTDHVQADHVDFIIGQWRQERPDLAIEPMAIIGRLKRLTTHLQQGIETHHKRYGLIWGEFDVLATLLRSGKPYCLTPTQLFRSAMLSSGAMTNRLNNLEKRGLIERLPDPDDRRSLLVKLSPDGFRLISEAVGDHVDNEAHLMSALSAEDIRQLNDILKRWLAGFE
ncbi:MarR family winged helix-turn-helix transcriptional regulator [Thalassolituus sp. LLYu03]|uniref:MarR family winged helix-turn-helix transcriptional regulator n=1 Tax=Thalassolituus sp. LLYu03 TaxID=3421656 RepID=UPI003D2D2A9D